MKREGNGELKNSLFQQRIRIEAQASHTLIWRFRSKTFNDIELLALVL